MWIMHILEVCSLLSATLFPVCSHRAYHERCNGCRGSLCELHCREADSRTPCSGDIQGSDVTTHQPATLHLSCFQCFCIIHKCHVVLHRKKYCCLTPRGQKAQNLSVFMWKTPKESVFLKLNICVLQGLFLFFFFKDEYLLCACVSQLKQGSTTFIIHVKVEVWGFI